MQNFYIKDLVLDCHIIRNSFWEGLHRLKIKYGISIRLLVNIAIRNVLLEEGMLEEKKYVKDIK